MIKNYFEKWSNEMAYYLGWIWADGSTGGGKLQIGCQTEDEEILLNFTRAINSHYKIIHRPGRIHKKGYKIKPYTQSSICDKQMVNCLINKHGVLPRKTYIDLPFPKIKDKYLPHFIRGYFDGDGAIYETNGIVTLSIIGTKKFINGLQKKICEITGIPTHKIQRNKKTKCKNAGWNISWAKKSEVLTLLNFIYCSGVSLTRKNDIAKKCEKKLRPYLEECGIENKNGRIRLRFLSKRLGEYKTIDECKFARNYAHLKEVGFKYPISNPKIKNSRKKEIEMLVNKRLLGDKRDQRKIMSALD